MIEVKKHITDVSRVKLGGGGGGVDNYLPGEDFHPSDVTSGRPS